ncbi:hypothetical protein ACJRO7_005129 [Eucalyptus globulus]|uniref:RING-type E3 ubiquitin transferase n=1 Tax=Eucalyptus globulus TaxID=34317 RepID=A0ABD3J265_EUCGL
MRGALLGLAFAICCCYSAIGRSSATVILESSAAAFNNFPAKSAVHVGEAGICGVLEIADPVDACSALRRGGIRLSGNGNGNGTDLMRFALIVRGNCSFQDKIVNAQTAGFRAVIVYDDRDREKVDLEYVIVDPKDITIPAVFVSNETGQSLKEYTQVGTGECCIYETRVEKSRTVLVIFFISIIVISGILVLILTHHVKHVDDKIVAELPSFAFNSAQSSDKYTREVCAICLEDYKDGEILKSLPCQHGTTWLSFLLLHPELHLGCVESWLKKGGSFCPVCAQHRRTGQLRPITIIKPSISLNECSLSKVHTSIFATLIL